MHKIKIAVIGGGISGLSAAWLLKDRYHVELFEANNYLGGHSNTVDISVNRCTFPVDTGFLVFNKKTYPNLVELFKNLAVDVTKSDMSFSYSNLQEGIEWAGMSLNALFGHRKNLVSPRFWIMLKDIIRFRGARKYLSVSPDNTRYTVGDFLDEQKYSREFKDWYLLPMAGAIWSCSSKHILAYPFHSFLNFFENHGLLNLIKRPQWYSVSKGSREYVKKLTNEIPHIHLSRKITKIDRQTKYIDIQDSSGRSHQFSHLIMASHADESLAALTDASDLEKEVLGNINFSSNRAVLHTDESFLPSKSKIHAAWNFSVNEKRFKADTSSVSYLLNLLQPLPTDVKIILTLNPLKKVREEYLIKQLSYTHPILEKNAIESLSRLPSIQGLNNTWYCGAWTGNGFHEHGLVSAIRVAKVFGVVPPWERGAKKN